MDEGTWETTFAKLPKYIQATCTFVYIGDRLPSTTQKHYEVPWVAAEQYDNSIANKYLKHLGQNVNELGIDIDKLSTRSANKILNTIGMGDSPEPEVVGS